MPLKSDGLEEATINLTPMIDIVFLLVIFFMVGARFTELERSFDVKVPTEAFVEPRADRPDAVEVNVTKEGVITYSVGGELREVTEDELVEQLREAKANYEKQAVIVRGDREGQYQKVMDVLTACHRAEMVSISVAYRVVKDSASRESVE